MDPDSEAPPVSALRRAAGFATMCDERVREQEADPLWPPRRGEV